MREVTQELSYKINDKAILCVQLGFVPGCQAADVGPMSLLCAAHINHWFI